MKTEAQNYANETSNAGNRRQTYEELPNLLIITDLPLK